MEAETTLWVAGITALGGLLGFGLSFLVTLYVKRLDVLKGVVDVSVEKRFTDILDFIGNPGLQRIIRFFESRDPAELLTSLETLIQLNDFLSEQKEYLERLQRLISANYFNEVTWEIHNHLEANALFLQRLNEEKESKSFLRKQFYLVPLVRSILRNENSIFVESGSTLAYLILDLVRHLKDARPPSKKPLTICTNNIAIYMFLLFEEHIAPVLLPGKPTNQYGATFGDSNQSETCNPDAVRSFLAKHEVTTFLTTASYLDLDFGPHVSSAANYEMKQILNKYALENNCKNIFIITGEKIDSNVSKKNIGSDCKLIHDNSAGSTSNFSEESLEKVRAAFLQHLHNKNNFIISGSSDREICQDVLAEIKLRYPFLAEWGVPYESGYVAFLYHENLADAPLY